MNWHVPSLRSNPGIAIFLTLALGFFNGGLRIRKVALGSAFGVLLAGVLIGQANFRISPDLTSFVEELKASGFWPECL